MPLAYHTGVSNIIEDEGRNDQPSSVATTKSNDGATCDLHVQTHKVETRSMGSKRVGALPTFNGEQEDKRPRFSLSFSEPQDTPSNHSSVISTPSSCYSPHDRKLNVLIVTPVYPPFVSIGGGVAITYGALTDKLKERGHKVSVLSPRLGNVDSAVTNLYVGFPVILATFTNLRLLSKMFDEADVIVSPDNNVLPFLVVLSYWKSKPMLFNTHTNFKHVLESGGWLSRNFAAPFMDSCCKMFSQLATQTYTTSPSYMDVLLERGYRLNGVFSPRIKLAVFEKHDDPVEVKRVREWMKGGSKCEFVFVTASRWSEEKRIPLLAQTLPENCCLCIFGDGPEAEVEKILKLHDPQKRVFVHRGMVNQERLRVLYKASDFLVSASAFETLGMTVAEAHLCGTPSIVQNAPGFVSQIVPGQNGFLVDFEANDASFVVAKCVSQKPTAAMIKKTIDARWDSSLPNLEDVVESVALQTDARKWDSWGSKVPYLLWIPCAILFYIIYRLSTYPFVEEETKRKTLCSDPGLLNQTKRLC